MIIFYFDADSTIEIIGLDFSRIVPSLTSAIIYRKFIIIYPLELDYEILKTSLFLSHPLTYEGDKPWKKGYKI